MPGCARRRGLRKTLLPGVVLLAACPLALPAAAHPTPPAGPSAQAVSAVGGPQLARTGVVLADPRVAAPPPVSSVSYVVADAGTGQIIAADNPHERLRPASTLKTLFALVAMPEISPNATYVGQEMDPSLAGTSLVGISPGITYTADQLWDGLFLVSGNDAVIALSQLAGGVPKVVAQMQAKARQLHALDTTVVNPDGLDADGQFSSAYDLTLFARADLQLPEFRTYCSRVTAQMPGKNGTTYQIQNQNHLLTQYTGAIGVKTGYTSLAHNTFIGAATRGGHTIIVTLMDSPPGIQTDDEKLLDWAFSVDGHAQPVGSLVAPQPAASPSPGVTDRPSAAAATARHSGGGSVALAALGVAAVLACAGSAAGVLYRRRHGRPQAADAARPTAADASALAVGAAGTADGDAIADARDEDAHPGPAG